MFEEKEYQIKEIMEMYGITRDAIKYYETHGLLHSYRRENGYRVFDEINVRKLKKILAMRDLGMTVEETLLHCNSQSAEERMAIMTQVRLRIEEEQREIGRKLKKIRELQKSVSENSLYASGFNVGYDMKFCPGCSQLTAEDRRSLAAVSAVTAHFNEEGLYDIKDSECIFYEDLSYPECAVCSRKLHLKQYYRCRIQYKGMDALNTELKKAFSDMSLLGYHADKNIYMMRKIIKQRGEDVLILDTILPFEL